MRLSKEQQTILEHVRRTEGLIMVSAVSGSGKTSMLSAIVEDMEPSSGLYISYNKAIADESRSKFPESVQCLTTHSMAYRNTVPVYQLKIGFFSYRNIKDRADYDVKLSVVDTLRDFCLSEFVSVADYCKHHDVSKYVAVLVTKYINLMESGQIDVTHEFYLKYFHILLATNHLEFPTFDLIMLDEAGDLNAVTLEIFKLLPATRKIMVGDPFQNIYSFNGTINGFEAMKHEATAMPMTQSFRVADHIALRIESFCQSHLDPDMKFRGVQYDDQSIESSAFISRTNSALISEMIDLNKAGTPYNLIRPAKQIFQLPLILLSLKPRGFISNPQYKHLQDDVNDYYSDRSIADSGRSLLSYLLQCHPDDVNLKSAVNLILKHSPAAVLECYKTAASHEGTTHPLTLMTAHSSKGLERDHVTIADDFNQQLAPLIDIKPEYRAPEDQELFRLYYVAVSRSKKSISNAVHL